MGSGKWGEGFGLENTAKERKVVWGGWVGVLVSREKRMLALAAFSYHGFLIFFFL